MISDSFRLPKAERYVNAHTAFTSSYFNKELEKLAEASGLIVGTNGRDYLLFGKDFPLVGRVHEGNNATFFIDWLGKPSSGIALTTALRQNYDIVE